MRAEDTLDATRTQIDAMAANTRQRLFAGAPNSRALFDVSAGYAIFDMRQIQ